MNDFPLLTLLILVPLRRSPWSSRSCPSRERRPAQAARRSLVSLLTLAVGVVVAASYDVGDGGLQLTETHEWISAFGVHYALGVDGLGLLMVLLTVAAGADRAARGVERRRDSRGPGARRFVAWTLALEALSLAVFAATDVFLFYVVFEATLVPAYFLIGGFGRENRSAAALKFLMFQLGGGLVLLGSVIGLYVVSAQQGSPSYLYTDLQQLDISTERRSAGCSPASSSRSRSRRRCSRCTRGWPTRPSRRRRRPACCSSASSTRSAPSGCCGSASGLFPGASDWATPLVVVLALISIVYGAFLAIGQDDILRLIGLTSLSHFGFITLGIFVFTAQGASGSILYMVNHGIATAALFLIAGFLIKRRGTTLISEMGGLEKKTPVLAGLFLVAGLATVGLPGLSQFVSEILVLIARLRLRLVRRRGRGHRHRARPRSTCCGPTSG